MKAEEQLPGDYAALTFAYLLKTTQETSNEQFATALHGLFDQVAKDLPPNAKGKPAYLVLEAYFSLAGDIRKWLRDAEDVLERSVGYENHRDAMDRLRMNVRTGVTLLKLMEKLR